MNDLTKTFVVLSSPGRHSPFDPSWLLATEQSKKKSQVRLPGGSISRRFGIAVVHPPLTVWGNERGLTKRLEIERRLPVARKFGSCASENRTLVAWWTSEISLDSLESRLIISYLIFQLRKKGIQLYMVVMNYEQKYFHGSYMF